MHEAVELKQQLQTEYEQTFVALHTKQKEINQLQKAWVQTDQEHEEALHLLKVKVRDLELICRSYGENFNHLPKELLDFYLQSAPVEIKTDPSFKNQIQSTQGEKLPPITTGFEAQSKKGNGSVTQTPLLISQLFSCVLPTGHIKPPELRSTTSSPVITERPNSSSQLSPSEMEDEASPSPRSKPRYTGQVRLCTARYSYNPYDGPNEHPEAELPLVAGKYLYVYGEMDDDGFYEGELLDGQRGLVPSNFVEFVQDKEKPTEREEMTWALWTTNSWHWCQWMVAPPRMAF
ncbi:hypothetical protein OJAV_G00118630 [Oryzias javanicus]|uniref:SH3 domain-containing protein n=1 Tax=Oryzias javanicus TaxID=123683 RepID=A0A3S2PFR8_ORYJA|nr:hypothetical protein OJAV_G00118630 [Oryzias javanicus]